MTHASATYMHSIPHTASKSRWVFVPRWYSSSGPAGATSVGETLRAERPPSLLVFLETLLGFPFGCDARFNTT